MKRRQRYVIDRNNIPRRAPIHLTVTILLAAKVADLGLLVWGVVFSVITMIWILFIRNFILNREQEVNIFNPGATANRPANTDYEDDEV